MNGQFSLLDEITFWWRKHILRQPMPFQVAALCYRLTDAGHDVLLVTSLGRGNWILPKGWPEDGKTNAEMAAVEAHEEAGVIGRPRDTPLGRFRYTKTKGKNGLIACEADVFAIEVADMADDYLEKGKRDVAWFTPKDAAEKVVFPELRDMLLKFQP